MKKIFCLSVILIILSASFSGAEESASQEILKLNITFLGSSHYSDVNFMIKNIKRSSQIISLVPSGSTRGVVSFSGAFHGPSESLIEEIKGLAENRFSIEIPKQKKDSISITLRKITAPQS